MVNSAQYREWRATFLGGTTESLEQRLIFDLAGSLQGKRVLDIGCGDGAYSIGAAERGARVTGVDLSSDMLASAKQRAEERGVRVEWLAGDARALPFAADSFDVVLAVTVLCFISDAGPAVREMARVLVPGGCVVIGELGRHSTWAALRRIRGWLGSPSWREASFRTPRDLRVLVEKAGLQVEATRGSVYYPPAVAFARWMAPFDSKIGTITAEGAAFVGVLATKRKEGPS